SIPIVIAGSALFLAILERFPRVVWAGGALLGWIAGGLLPDDPIILQFTAIRYGMSIAPSWWPANARGIVEYVEEHATATFDTAYSWFGYAGHLKFAFGLEPVEFICNVIGAIIVVVAGLYLVKTSARHQAQALAPSS